MKRKITLLLFSLIASYGFSQVYYRAVPYDTLGTSHIRIIYEMKFMPDTLERDNFNKRIMLLDIGENGFSCYTEYNNWRQDSVSVLRIKDNKISEKDLNDVRRYGGRVYDHFHILKSHPDANHLMFIGNAGLDKFIYDEQTPNFGWQLKPTEKKEIGGYTCSLAIGSYAGRTYKAWFTTEIPVSDGPWKFCGLPGLILEAEDLSGEYFFSCTKIQKHDDFIAIRGMDTAFKTTRERFLKAFQRAKEDPGAIIQSLGNKVQGDLLKKKQKKRAYNPQEKY